MLDDIWILNFHFSLKKKYKSLISSVDKVQSSLHDQAVIYASAVSLNTLKWSV